MACDIIWIPDTHGQFVDKARLHHIAKDVKRKKPRLVVHIGDLFDLWLLSRFPKRELKLLTRFDRDWETR